MTPSYYHTESSALDTQSVFCKISSFENKISRFESWSKLEAHISHKPVTLMCKKKA